jgi:flagella basal body P-ring formation protein FlgA
MKPLLLALGLLGLAAPAAAAPLLEIALRTEVEAAGARVTLGEVAVLRSADLDVLRRLVDLPVAHLVRPGAQVRLAQPELREVIRRGAGLPADAQRWSGPEHSRVWWPERHLDGQQIAAAAHTALQDWLDRRAPGARAHLPRLPRDVEIPPGPVQLQARVPTETMPRHRMVAWVDVWSQARHLRTVAVAFDVDLPVRPSAGVPPAATREPTLPLASVAPAPAPLVLRGEWAVVRSSIGQVLTEARVQVLQDGRPGDSVQVRQAGIAQPLRARVTQAGQLEMP